MKEKVMCAAVLAVVSTLAQAQSSVTLYGFIDAGVTYVNHVSTSAGPRSVVKFADGVAHGNRWGLKGQEDLGGGIKAIFTLENGFNLGTGTFAQGGAEFGRQAFVGLTKANVGALTFGRQYPFSHQFIGTQFSTGGLTVLGNYGYHPNNLDQFTTNRINNSVKFTSANYAGLRFGAMYGFSNQAGAFSGSLPTTAPTSAGSSRVYSFGAEYLSGPVGVGVAYTSVNYPSAAVPAFSVSIANVNTNGLRNIDTLGVGARYALGPALLYGNFSNTRLQPVTGKESVVRTGELGGQYAVTPALKAVLSDSYTKMSDGFEGKWNQVNAALQYYLSKHTDVYVMAVYQKASGSNRVAGANVPVQAEIGSSPSFIGNAGTDKQFVARVGVRHSF